MDEQVVRQIHRHIDEHNQYLCERLDSLTELVRSIHQEMAGRMDSHEAYHQQNEHVWGLIKLAGRYPFRLAGGAFLTAWALGAATPESLRALRDWARRLVVSIFG